MPVTNSHEVLAALLRETNPEHDTELGLLHPYWARKPLNVVTTIIETLTSEGALIVDPFLGSGTTMFAALLTKRRVVGADINPLATHISEATLRFAENPQEYLSGLTRFYQEFASKVLPWFKFDEDSYVERERFEVAGEYAGGRFTLNSYEVVLKSYIDGKFVKRRATSPSEAWLSKTLPEGYMKTPINFSEVNLLQNSRIAIPEDAKLADFYTPLNQAAINIALSMIRTGSFSTHGDASVLTLLVSSALPLFRLSDPKASSQWPYWRPKQALTSRNPVIVLESRLRAFARAAEWLADNLPPPLCAWQVQTVPIQKLELSSKADLILTDPPYSDHAPYLEYSASWTAILGLDLPSDAYSYEIVKTDALGRSSDAAEYAHRLQQGLRRCSRLVRLNGYVVWFYQDMDLNHWAKLAEAARDNCLKVVQVIALPKQRRSMKTVASPGRTLDGDLLLVFQKTRRHVLRSDVPTTDLEGLVRNQLLKLPQSASYFEKYAVLIKIGLELHILHEMASRWKSVKHAIERLSRGSSQPSEAR